jgi:hypothetical protein
LAEEKEKEFWAQQESNNISLLGRLSVLKEQTIPVAGLLRLPSSTESLTTCLILVAVRSQFVLFSSYGIPFLILVL